MWNNENCKQEVDNECPYCHEHLYMNKRIFANHVRWCKCNPRYEDIKKSTIEKNKIKNTLPKLKYKLICEICGTEYYLELTEHKYNSGKYKKTCCDKCAKQLSYKNIKNKELVNKKRSISLHHFYNTEIKSNNYNYITKEYILICKCCGKKFISKNKKVKYCSNECRIKTKYINNINKLLYNNDIQKLKILQRIYHKQCDFKFALNEYPKEFNFKLIEEFGWYKALNHGNNLNGVSRDHIFAVMDGYSKLIDPYLISHPANCRLLQHCENISKYNKSDINLEELIERVKNWNNKYGIYPNKISYDILEKFGIQVNRFNI